jgi:hypothetical protein
VPNLPRAGLAIALVAIALPLLAGCGGGGSTSTTSETTTTSAETTTSTEATASTTDWANGFCTAFATWTAAMKGIGTALQSNPTKANLQSTGDDIKSANQTLVDDLRGLGKPDIPRGQDAKDATDELATKIDADSEKITNSLQDLSSVSDLANAASVVTTTLATLETQVNDTLNQLQSIAQDESGSLKDALKNSSACKELANSS